ncbi:MAG: DUF3800 domain-containing protein [Gemmataceae bacterium]|nr:DUF3800 domain-containing protein [Gemmataceae bacterium]
MVPSLSSSSTRRITASAWRFFEAIRPERFRYHSFALNKRKTVGQGFRHKDSAYKAPIRFLFENIRHDLPGATVWFDRCGDRGFADNLKNYLMKRLRDKTGKSPFRKIKSVTSHSNVLIQMADMVCGAVACSLKPERTDAADYRNAIKSHEVRLRVWP